MNTFYLWHRAETPQAILPEGEPIEIGRLLDVAIRGRGDFFHYLEIPKNEFGRRARRIKNGPTCRMKPVAGKVLSCFEGITNARNGELEMVLRRSLPERPAVACLTLSDWIGLSHPKIISEDEFGPSEWRQIHHCAEALNRLHKTLNFDAPKIPGLHTRVLAEESGFRFIAAPNALIAEDLATGVMAGGIYRGLILVEPEFRGRRLSPLIHYHNDKARHAALAPSHFSEAGYAARKAAHRLICTRAIEEGLPVHEENLRVYDLRSCTDPEETPSPV